jgi:hypothetical protein
VNFWVPPAVDEILKKVLAKNRNDRYARGKDFSKDLRQVLQDMKKYSPQV